MDHGPLNHILLQGESVATAPVRGKEMVSSKGLSKGLFTEAWAGLGNLPEALKRPGASSS